MSASPAKIDFVFDHIIEHPRCAMPGRRSATGPVLLGLLTIIVASALFVPSPTVRAMPPIGQLAMNQAR